jgi:hypothetical protein
MYVLRFPAHVWDALRPVFEQQGLTSQVSTVGRCVVAKVDDVQAVALKLDPVFKRIGPIGGWEESKDRDVPSTPPPEGSDFS